jgi:hypothetical protein
MKSQKLTKKAKKIYLADFDQQYQQKIIKQKEGKTTSKFGSQ